MTYEEFVSHLPAELKALGYKMVNRRTMIENVTNFHLDNDCQDCLIRIVHSNNKCRQCICYSQNIHSTEWKLCYYKDFNDVIYYNIMDSAKRMVAQFKQYSIDLKIDKLSKDFK